MELKIANEKLKASRIKRAWSQEQLAQVSGLGLRTIQRIESTGFASYESVKAIASCLELPVSELIEESSKAKFSKFSSSSVKKLKILTSTSLVGLFVFLLARGVAADQVALDVGVTIDNEETSQSLLVTEEGQEAILQIDGQYQISISPTVAGSDEVHLQVRLLKYDGETYVPIARPRLVTRANEEVEVRSNVESVGSITVKIRPSLN